VAVGSEVLLTAGLLSESVYASTEPAREHRNDVAHRVPLSAIVATQAAQATAALIEDVLWTTVALPQVVRGTNSRSASALRPLPNPPAEPLPARHDDVAVEGVSSRSEAVADHSAATSVVPEPRKGS
jgi:hypothetical protein